MIKSSIQQAKDNLSIVYVKNSTNTGKATVDLKPLLTGSKVRFIIHEI